MKTSTQSAIISPRAGRALRDDSARRGQICVAVCLAMALTACAHPRNAARAGSNPKDRPLLVWKEAQMFWGWSIVMAIYPDGRVFLGHRGDYDRVTLSPAELHQFLTGLPFEALVEGPDIDLDTPWSENGGDLVVTWRQGLVVRRAFRGAGSFDWLQRHRPAAALLPSLTAYARLIQELISLRKRATPWAPHRIEIGLNPVAASELRRFPPRPWPRDLPPLDVPCRDRSVSIASRVPVAVEVDDVEALRKRVTGTDIPAFLVNGCAYWVDVRVLLPGEASPNPGGDGW